MNELASAAQTVCEPGPAARRILVADDDRVTRRMLEVILHEWGYQTLLAPDGLAALEILQGSDAPRLAVLDWLMPGMDGLEVCRKVRAMPTRQPTYLILLTIKGSRKDIVAGLQGGADDYVAKPFDPEELQARLHAGWRIVDLQDRLGEQMKQMEDALARVKQLQGLLPICCYCKKIRDDQNYWEQMETFISSNSDVRFSHGICPTCLETRLSSEMA
jgi:sigma-B regulation protein RsbU (phosphoserine phosphatase)